MDTPSMPATPMDAPVGAFRQCTAKSKRTRQQCKRRAAVGFEVCAMHGGKSLIGPANPAFKHGRYSRLLPRGLRERFEQLQADPELLSLRKEVALVRTRIEELLDRLGPDAETADDQTWGQISHFLEQQRRLVESENAILLKGRGVVTVEQATILMEALVGAVMRCDPTDQQRRAISREWLRILGREGDAHDLVGPGRARWLAGPADRGGEGPGPRAGDPAASGGRSETG